MPAYVHSWSSIQAFHQCPKKGGFKYEHLNRGRGKSPSAPSLAAGIGTVVHEAVAQILRDHGLPDDQDVIEVWLDSQTRSNFPGITAVSEDDRKAVLDSATRIIRKWGLIAREVFPGHRVVEVETRFSLTIGDIRIEGIVDAVTEDAEGRFWIIDWKTGSLKTEHRSQIGLYCLWGADQFLPGASGLQACLVDLGTGNRRQETANSAKVQRLRRYILSVCTGVEAQLERGDLRARPSRACRLCAYLDDCEEGQAHAEAT